MNYNYTSPFYGGYMNSFRASKLQFGESRCRKSLGKCSNTSFKPSLQPVKQC